MDIFSPEIDLKMRFSPALVGAGSIAATSITVANAFLINKQFYPSMVYLTKNNASMMVIYFQALIIVYTIFQMMKKLFFGELRAAEAEQLNERTWHAILETCLAFTVFRDDFSPIFVCQFVMLLFAKSFHWIADDRVDWMEQSPLITIKFHVRLMSVIGVLGFIDSYLLSHAYFSIVQKGPSSQIVFGFEYAILVTMVLHIALKYILHMHDMRTAQAWENKAVYLLYGEVIINLMRCVLYGMFALVMMKLHTFPLFSIRPFYVAARSLLKAFNDVFLSRRAINAMNNLFPVVSADELAGMDATCIICREEMTVESHPKRLPCSHVFHVHCLRSWFQRQQNCPTCRTDILGQGINAARDAAAARRNGNAAANANGGAPAPHGLPHAPNLIQFMVPHQFHLHAPLHFQNIHNPNVPPRPPGPGPAGLNASGSGVNIPMPPPHFMPMGMPMGRHPFMPMMAPPTVPFPARPTFDGLSDSELRSIEGDTRAAVESRIRVLENIGYLLDAASLQMHQYLSASNVMGIPPGVPFNSMTSTPSNSAPTTVQAPSAVGSVHHPSPASTSGNIVTSPPDTNITRVADSTGPGSSEINDLSSSTAPVTSPLADEIRQRRMMRFGEDSASSSSSSPVRDGDQHTVAESLIEASDSSPALRDTDAQPDSADEIRRRRIERFTDDGSS